MIVTFPRAALRGKRKREKVPLVVREMGGFRVVTLCISVWYGPLIESERRQKAMRPLRCDFQLANTECPLDTNVIGT